MARNRRKRPISPWQKIVRASFYGTGLKLTRYEVAALADDVAIYQVAQDECEDQKSDGFPLPEWAP